jgi:AraC family transcriptional regulator
MTRVGSPLNRFFIHPQYSIFYRRVKTLNWQEPVRPEYALLVVLSGALEYQVGGHSGRITTNQGLLIEPSTAMSTTARGVEFLFFTLAPSFLLDFAVRMRLVGPAGNIGFAKTVLQPDERLTNLASSLAAELNTDDAGREIVLAAGVEQLVVHVLRNFSNMRRSDELELSRVGLIDRRIRRAVELMQAQMERDLSLKEIAAASYLSPFHFSRLFKKLTGASPHAYLATLRSRQAQLLLAETDLSITEISSRVGYATSSHFTKAFRQATGFTPRAFRKAIVSR